MNGKTRGAMDSDDFDWTPPTEAELKVINAKRERADKISKLMGDYLLKGYRMLGTTCTTCDTILLKDKQLRDYCVACSELETEHAKDDPALSQAAAISQVQEQQHTKASNSKESPTSQDRTNALRFPSSSASSVPRPSTEAMETQEGFPARPHLMNSPMYQANRVAQQQQIQVTHEVRVVIGSSLEAVVNKLAWASQELHSTHSVEASAGLCNLIKSCADAISALHRLAPQELTD